MIRIGIISDIHSHEFNPNEKQGGYYFPSMPDRPIHKNPFSSLKKLIDQEEILLDYLLSPGDYAHKIDSKGLKSAWDQLKLITNQVKAKQLIGTIGNHDVNSRDGDNDSFKFIKEFDLDFPVYPSKNSEQHRSDLLNKSYYFIEDESLNILFIIINSCYDHWNTIEASKGKIKIDNLDGINQKVKNSKLSKKVLMVHHNPINHETGIQDTDLIEGVEELMKNISEIDMIIYGHKHDFRFSQKQKQPKNINLLGAGSFSCFKTELKTTSQNSFHIVEFHSDEVKNCINHGIIKTYLYNPHSGWAIADYLKEGVGCVLSENEIYNDFCEWVKANEAHYEDWKDVITGLPFLNYITLDTSEKVLEKMVNEKVIKQYNYNKDRTLQSIILK